MKRRRIASLTLAIIMCASILAPLSLARWSNTSSLSVTFSFTGNTANCSAEIVGMTGSSRVEGTLTLQKKSGSNWIDVTSTFKGQNYDTIDISYTYSCISKTVYRLRLDSSVRRNGEWEDLTIYSGERTCP